MSAWRQIEPGLLLLRDSCNVYALAGQDGAWLLINAGSGLAAHALGELEVRGPLTVLLTHHFRDHTAGAVTLAQSQPAIIVAPWQERAHLAGRQPAFRGRPTEMLYDLTWDNFAPIAPMAVDRWMMDYERTCVAGRPIEVIPTPGVTLGAVTYLITTPAGRRLAFVGELMHSPGRLARLSPLQYNYNDLLGLDNVLASWRRVLARDPDLILPSLGEPFANPGPAVALLRRNCAGFEAVQPGIAARLAQPPATGVEEILPRLYRARGVSAEVYFVVSRSRRVLALDYGYDVATVRFPNRAETWNRRAILHSLDALADLTGARWIDTVIATHYHDDHVAGVPLLQRLFDTKLWAGENFADLLERPQDFDRPCLWPEPMRVHRRLKPGVRQHWEDVAVTTYPMVGHTEFSTLLLIEFDGRRVAHTGDQLFFLDPATGRLCPPGEGGVFTNHVYRNGIALGGYAEFVQRLQAFAPEVILSGHHAPYPASADLWPRLETVAAAFDRVHQAVLPIGEAETHFGLESQAAKLIPHTLPVQPGQEVQLQGWILNPCPHNATAELRLETERDEWKNLQLHVHLGPREKQPFVWTLPAVSGFSGRCREPLALTLAVAGRPYGQVAHAWIFTAGANCH